MKLTSAHSSSEAFCSRTRQPRRRRSELQPRERVDRDDVRLDAGDVAERDRRAGPAEQRADPVAEPGQVGARDRAPDRERDTAVGNRHRDIDREPGENSSHADR